MTLIIIIKGVFIQNCYDWGSFCWKIISLIKICSFLFLLMTLFKDDYFNENYIATMGVDFVRLYH